MPSIRIGIHIGRRRGAPSGASAPAAPTLTAPTATSPSPNAILINSEASLSLAATAEAGLGSVTWVAYKAGESTAHASATTLGTDADGSDTSYAATDAVLSVDTETHGHDWEIVAVANGPGGSTPSTALSVTIADPSWWADNLTGDGTWPSPANAIGISDGVRNRWDWSVIAPGAGSTTNTGPGGGGAAGNRRHTGSASTGYAVAGINAVAADTDGTTATVGSTLMTVDAGKKPTGGSPGVGGLAASCTNCDTAHDGHAGTGTTGTTTGGAAAGFDSAAASATVPGDPNGGFGLAGANSRDLGGGAGSTDVAQAGGARGWFRSAYLRPAEEGFAVLVGETRGRATGDSTSHTFTIPAGENGDVILVEVGSDGSPTISATGYTEVVQGSVAFATGAVLYRVATGSDGTTISLTASEMIAWRVTRWRHAGTPDGTITNATSTNANPPSHTHGGGSGKHAWIAGMCIDTSADLGGTLTNLANYGALLWIPGRAGIAVGLASAIRFREIETEDPPNFVHSSEQWVAWTIAIPRAP